MTDVLAKEVTETIEALKKYRQALSVKINDAESKLEKFEKILGELHAQDVVSPSQIHKPKSASSATKSAELKALLIERGAGNSWVQYTYSAMGHDLARPATDVSKYLKELEADGLRICRISSGKLRGNHYTFSDLVEPAQEPNSLVPAIKKVQTRLIRHEAASTNVAVKLAAPVKLEPSASDIPADVRPDPSRQLSDEDIDAVRNKLQDIKKKLGDTFSISWLKLAKASGVSADTARRTVQYLALRGELEITRTDHSKKTHFLNMKRGAR